jgi:hypothetical protein
MAKPKENSLIHLRFDHTRAIGARKDLLNSEISFLNLAKSIKKYKTLRAEELKKKEMIYSKIKSVKTDLNKLKKSLPKVVIPKILKKELLRNSGEVQEVENQKKVTKYGTIEDQLKQIQAKLKELEKH